MVLGMKLRIPRAGDDTLGESFPCRTLGGPARAFLLRILSHSLPKVLPHLDGLLGARALAGCCNVSGRLVQAWCFDWEAKPEGANLRLEPVCEPRAQKSLPNLRKKLGASTKQTENEQEVGLRVEVQRIAMFIASHLKEILMFTDPFCGSLCLALARESGECGPQHSTVLAPE